jgi:tRNA-2-methylthio-N6-dimethylallyladenosine synthase
MTTVTRGERAPDDAHETTTYELTTDQTSNAARKYHIWTIGCQMNVADSNHVAAELEKIGYGPTDRLDEADVVVLNTCVVRQSAEDKAIGKLGSLKPWKRAKTRPHRGADGLHGRRQTQPATADAYPFVDVFMPPSEAAPLVNFLRQAEIDAEMAEIERQQLAQRYQPAGRGAARRHGAVDQAPGAERGSARRRARAHRLRLQPRLHLLHHPLPPRRRTQPPRREIVNEVRGLVAQGVREVTLLGPDRGPLRLRLARRAGQQRHGQSISGSAEASGETRRHNPQYHNPQFTSYDLADLLRAVHEIDGLWRIRFLTSHPNYMTDRILETVRDLPKLCPHIEVPDPGRRR